MCVVCGYTLEETIELCNKKRIECMHGCGIYSRTRECTQMIIVLVRTEFVSAPANR